MGPARTYAARATLVAYASMAALALLIGLSSTSHRLDDVRPVDHGDPHATIIDVDPGEAGQGAANLVVTIDGAGIDESATVSFGGAGIAQVGDPVVNGLGTQMQVTIDIASNAATTEREVVITNEDGEDSACAPGGSCAFTVNAGPKITSISPSALGQRAAVEVTITGSGFHENVEVTEIDGVTIDEESMTVTPTQITMDVTVDETAAPGARDVTVTNPDDAGTDTRQNGITINAKPEIQNVVPNFLSQGATSNLTVNGAGFVAGGLLKVEFSHPGITATGVTFATATRLTGTVTVADGVDVGTYNATVTNGDGGVSDACSPDCFSVGPGPTISCCPNPSSLPQGASQKVVTVTGGGFASGAQVSFLPATGFTIHEQLRVDSGTIEVTLSIASNATLGFRDVKVTNPDQSSATFQSAFQVSPGPSITSVSPETVPNTAPVELTIDGAEFQTGAQALLQRSGRPDIAGTNVQISESQIKATFDVRLAVGGTWSVRVTNPDEGSGVCTSCLTVTIVDPAVASILPGSRGQGATDTNVEVIGMGFQPDATVTFSGTGITINSTTLNDSTKITVNLTIAPNASTGARNVTVVNPDDKQAGCSNCFTVNAGPTVTTVNPPTLPKDSSGQTVTVSGGGFAGAVVVSFSGAGVTVSETVVNDASTLTLTVSVAADAAPGARDVIVTNGDGGRATCVSCFSVQVAGRFRPLSPSRILDTRTGNGGQKVGPNFTMPVQVTGRGGVPDSGVTGVALNVTATNATANSYLTLFPTGVAQPFASNLNFGPGDPAVPNLVTVGVGNDGKVSVFNFEGSVDVIFDVAGWYSEGGSANEGRFQPVSPARILDTRNSSGKIGPNQSIELQVAGQGGVPAGGVGAVTINATVTDPTAPGYLTIFPPGPEGQPVVSNVNFVAGQTVPNRVVVKVSDGKIRVFNSAGSSHVVIDVNGWFTDADNSSGGAGMLSSLTPSRILDTRTGLGGDNQKVGADQSIPVQVTGRGGVPSTGVTAVVVNATITNPTASSYLTLFPDGEDKPVASDLNFVPDQTRPNLVKVKVGQGGKIQVFNAFGTVHVILDVVGWYS